ncbi:MAG: hypothetical protein J4O11_03685 [Chloroflexi bacterium]|nr:hypothetical protein [Chloroflexota bacterium]
MTSVPGATGIFDVIAGKDPDYDEKLFDALAEVRLAAWARIEGYRDIEKLNAGGEFRTPEFSMTIGQKTVLAEAKHFRGRDYFVNYVADRLEGLALTTGKLTDFGLQVWTSDKYSKMLTELRSNRIVWLKKAREELTEPRLLSLERTLKADPDAEVQIIEGLFSVRRGPTPGRVFGGWTYRLSPREAVELCLLRIQEELLAKLEQVRTFIEASGYGAAHVIIFFSGVDEWESEWSELWKSLDSMESWAWDRVATIKAEGDKLIGLPFELIVGRYKTLGTGKFDSVEYRAFHWQP